MFKKYVVALEVKEGNPDPKEGQGAVVKKVTITAGSSAHAAQIAEKKGLGKVLTVEAK
jgi:hypothetical protein